MAETQHCEVAGGEPPTATMVEIQPSRRSPRKAAAVPVWLRREGQGRTWEEETETRVLSRYGGCLECRHTIEAGGLVAILRRDNGHRAIARVRYCRFDAEGHREIGVEFLNCDNFWDVDWNFSAPPVPPPEALRTPSGPAQDEPEPAEKPRRKRQRSRGLGNILVAREKRLWEAINAKDLHVLESLLAHECVWVTSEGGLVKSPDLHDLSELGSTDCTHADFKVTVLNKAAAIVMFQGVERGSDPKALAPLHTYHASVWANRDGKWELVFHQQTRAA